MDHADFPRAAARWIACLAFASPLVAAAASGEFTFVVGDVSVTKANGQRVVPVRGTAVDAGDRISTGANGMAQLTMVDNARLSLRPATQFLIEQYADRRDSPDGAVLSLIKGTLRTFTGLIASTNRDKFIMKTRVATVGIRGSGNILYACEGQECDPGVASQAGGEGAITVNHTIEGSHAVTNLVPGAPSGLPAQQGGSQTLITGPGQTVMVQGVQPPRYIPTPTFIAESATNMTGAKPGAAAASEGTAAETRNFAPSDVPALPANATNATPIVGSNPLGFPTIDATANVGSDPTNLRDVVIVGGAPFLGQAVAGEVTLEGNNLRGYRSYAGTLAGTVPGITGGSPRDSIQVPLEGGGNILMGRYENAGIGYFGENTPLAGSIHWILGPAGYPTYLSDVLTGVATYTLAGNTAPTTQNNVAGTLGSAALNVNFTNRTLSLALGISIPAQGSNPGGTWRMNADNVAISLNSFFGSTGDRLVITNGAGQSSQGNSRISGSFEGSFVGNGLSGAIVGYHIDDSTSVPTTINGVAAFTGPRQNGGATYREGRVSDPAGTLADFVRSYSTTNRPDEVTGDAEGRVSAFAAPYARLGTHASYSLGTAQVVQSGFDPETGMVWGRWSGGVAQVTRGGSTDTLNLQNTSLHYIFAGTQAGPVNLPLTGTATYDVIGSTRPTDFNGHVGTLDSATLNANFTNRTADASVNLAINGQTWTGSASNMPIYRDQYFSAFSGTPIAGVPNPSPLTIGCTPNCGQGATGSFDGFFTGRTGQRAGLMYNLGGNQGAVAFGRRGG